MNDRAAHTFKVEQSTIAIYSTKAEMGHAAAREGAAKIRGAIDKRGLARVMVATGNSQLDMVRELTRSPEVDWKKVELFHMDEYVGILPDHPASLRFWLQKHMLSVISPARVHLIQGETPDSSRECRRYEQLIRSARIDVCFLGIGENGHIAFNDPHVADFNDQQTIKKVDLDERSRLQQVKEGHFSEVTSVPREAFTVTCSALLAAEAMICCVPEERKAEAVRYALKGPVTTACPGSVLRQHPDATIFLDKDSAHLLSKN